MEEHIGIIGAMIEEIENFKEGMSDISESNKAGITFYQGKMNDQFVVLCQSGVGKVNAAVCTQILIDNFQVTKVIFTGVAGGLAPDLEIGDIVISTAAKQHDIDASALGFPKGTIPFAIKSEFKANEELVNLAVRASMEINQGKTVTGLILSGDQFIAGGNSSKELFEQFGGYCTEMEGAAVAQACDMNNVPFVIVRSMSDKADGSAHTNFSEFTRLASKNSYQIVDKMLEMLSELVQLKLNIEESDGDSTPPD